MTPGVTGDAVPDMGTVSGGTYTNRFAGISCTLDDSWYFYTDEQIDELNGFVRESTSDEENVIPGGKSGRKELRKAP